LSRLKKLSISTPKQVHSPRTTKTWVSTKVVEEAKETQIKDSRPELSEKKRQNSMKTRTLQFF